jgi:hypothetical protein
LRVKGRSVVVNQASSREIFRPERPSNQTDLWRWPLSMLSMRRKLRQPQRGVGPPRPRQEKPRPRMPQPDMFSATPETRK